VKPAEPRVRRACACAPPAIPQPIGGSGFSARSWIAPSI
jgi:hypothetical protein